MTDPSASNANSYITEDGFERIFCTTVLNQELYQKLEDYRMALEISRSAALRRILSEHFSRQLSA